jgi:hypothetical protein
MLTDFKNNSGLILSKYLLEFFGYYLLRTTGMPFNSANGSSIEAHAEQRCEGYAGYVSVSGNHRDIKLADVV